MPRLLFVFACILPLGAAAFAIACGGNGSGGNATATSQLQATGTSVATAPSASATPGLDIRSEDLTKQPGLKDYLSSTGGQVTPSSIIYADLTGDQVDEAIVPVSSGGEGGHIALFVYGYQPAGLTELLRVAAKTRLAAAVASGALQVTEASGAPGDPLCCPSALTKTTYRWDGTKLVVAKQETVAGTPGQKT